VGLAHGAGVECRDLVVVGVGDDDGRGGVVVFDGAHELQAHAHLRQVLAVGLAILAQGGHDQGFAAQLLQAVGDVAGTATKFFAQRGRQEGHVQDVHLLGQDLLRETAMEVGDGVERERATNEHGHGEAFQG
jgi:hypothetical protein